MGKKLFVGNLSFQTTQDGLEGLFGRSGTVGTARIATDRFSGKPRGFAFVEMSSDEEAQTCIRELDGYNFEGRQLSVSIAKPPASRDNDRGERSYNRSY